MDLTLISHFNLSFQDFRFCPFSFVFHFLYYFISYSYSQHCKYWHAPFVSIFSLFLIFFTLPPIIAFSLNSFPPFFNSFLTLLSFSLYFYITNFPFSTNKRVSPPCIKQMRYFYQCQCQCQLVLRQNLYYQIYGTATY